MDKDMMAQGPAHASTGPTPAEDREHSDLFTTLTPGFIISTLRPSRAHEVSSRLQDELDDAPRHDSTGASRALLRLLTDEELRRIARLAGMPAEGQFLSLYHRLALLC